MNAPGGLTRLAAGGSYDAVVIGSGPNGLVAAVRLAMAGRSVALYEAADTVGGGCRSAELTLPGFVHDVCSTVQALAVASPAIAGLDLGPTVRFANPEIPLVHPLDGGRAAVLHRSLAETAAGLGADGRAWTRLFGRTVEQWDRIIPFVLGPVLKLPRHPLAVARFGIPGLLPASLLQRAFDGDEAAALFGGCAAHSFLPLSRPLSSSFGLMLAASAHAVGWPVTAGGSQVLSDALAATLRSLGGVIVTGRRITSLAELPSHRVALFDTNPQQMAAICGDALPQRYRDSLNAFRYGPAAFKVDYALDGPVPWTNEDARRAGTIHLGGTFAEVRAAEAESASGRSPARPFVLAVQASVFDPTRAPAGKHTLWAYAHVPHASPIDATAALEAQIERFAPGFRDLVLARHVITPAQFEEYNPNYVGGDINAGSFAGTQVVFRPTVRLRSYVTPNPRILLCSASTPPGGGVHGACGANAADRALAGPLR